MKLGHVLIILFIYQIIMTFWRNVDEM